MCSQFSSIINLARSCHECLESIKMPVVWPNGKGVDSNNTSLFLSPEFTGVNAFGSSRCRSLPPELCERMSPKSNQIMAVRADVKPSLYISGRSLLKPRALSCSPPSSSFFFFLVVVIKPSDKISARACPWGQCCSLTMWPRIIW